jgi:hypothetical protein
MRRTAGTRRPPTAIRSSGDWLRLVGGLVAVFVLFHWSAVVLGSDRGQAGVIVGAIVTGAILAVERWWFASTLLGAARALGFGVPGWTGPLSSAVISSVLVLMVPLLRVDHRLAVDHGGGLVETTARSRGAGGHR